MQIGFLSVLLSVASLVFLMLPGFILAKLGKIPEKGAEALSTFVLYGCQPFMIFMSFQEYTYSSEIGKNMLIVFGLSLAVCLIMFGIVMLAFRKCDEKKKKIMRYASVFSNCGFMGLPFLQVLFSGRTEAGEILIYASVVIMVFHIANWTMGVFLVTGSMKDASIKKIITNPCIIAVIVGFLVFVIAKKPLVDLSVDGTFIHELTEKFMSAFSLLGKAVTPVSMTVIGIKLSKTNAKQLFLEKSAYFVVIAKNIVMSFISILVVAFLPISSAVKYAVFLLWSMPSATSTTLFALQFGGDAECSSVYVLLSTIFSIITLPLMFLVINNLFGVAIV